MTNEPYQRKVSYLFEAAGYLWEATEWTGDKICIVHHAAQPHECHTGRFIKVGIGRWMLDDEDECLLEGLRHYEVLELIKFFNEHGSPETYQTVTLNEPHQAHLVIKGLVGPQKDDAVVAYPTIGEYTVSVTTSGINKHVYITLSGVF